MSDEEISISSQTDEGELVAYLSDGCVHLTMHEFTDHGPGSCTGFRLNLQDPQDRINTQELVNFLTTALSSNGGKAP